MTPQPGEGSGPPEGDGASLQRARGTVHIATVICGRCGWPNGCRVQQGMRALRFLCQWCGQMTTGIVDPSLKRNVIF